ncbi:uncharacterized protein LOC111263503 isoform X2 [Varroa jacobsoni]|uniref:uncharacterized protein LOC111263503 isoform X2 n=1 Tax=Varroa jacobsoni TaxID=62625 RepID=UPI000BF3D34C|nr:uncharacterized protein LOC111263503 isoform X2 [Varroa jacobsoni]
MFLTAISALNVIFAAIAQGLTDGVIHLSGSDLSGLKDDFDFLSVGCIHVGVRAGSILSCFVVATIHSRVRILQATSLIGLLGRGAILLTLPITGFTKASAHVLACIIGACQSVVEIAIYSRTNEAVFYSVSRIVIYLFNAFSSLGQLLAATIVHVQQPDERRNDYRCRRCVLCRVDPFPCEYAGTANSIEVPRHPHWHRSVLQYSAHIICFEKYSLPSRSYRQACR